MEKGFEGIPELTRLFEKMERDVKGYNRYKSKGISKEILIMQREELLKQLQKIDAIVLKIMWYIEKIEGISLFSILNILRKRYEVQCDFYEKIKGERVGMDIFAVRELISSKNAENSKKTVKTR